MKDEAPTLKWHTYYRLGNSLNTRNKKDNRTYSLTKGVASAKRILVHFELKIKASGGNNFIDFPENQLTKFRVKC